VVHLRLLLVRFRLLRVLDHSLLLPQQPLLLARLRLLRQQRAVSLLPGELQVLQVNRRRVPKSSFLRLLMQERQRHRLRRNPRFSKRESPQPRAHHRRARRSCLRHLLLYNRAPDREAHRRRMRSRRHFSSKCLVRAVVLRSKRRRNLRSNSRTLPTHRRRMLRSPFRQFDRQQQRTQRRP
jgi:hypothetical protein